jgi:hypothetical protein
MDSRARAVMLIKIERVTDVDFFMKLPNYPTLSFTITYFE